MTLERLDYKTYDLRPGVSQSQLQQMRRSPAHCKAYIDGHRKETEEKGFGKRLHSALLEPDTVDNLICPPDGCDDRRKKPYLDWAKSVPADKEIVTPAEMKCINGCIASVTEHKLGKLIFQSDTGFDAEVSLFATHGPTGLLRKCRIDVTPRGRNYLADVKTCQDASPREFERTVYFYGYHIQAAYYLDIARANGLDAECFIFIAVEKEPPYACGFYQLDQDAIERGRMDYERLLERFKQCHESGEWPAYSRELQFIGLPKWAREAA